jgi:membrane-associated phospholipid phosphatase
MRYHKGSTSGEDVARNKKILIIFLYAVAMYDMMFAIQPKQAVRDQCQTNVRSDGPSITISKRGKRCFPRRPSQKENLLGSLWRDVFDLGKYVLFSTETFKVISTTFPFYVAARMFDEKLQSSFHRRCCQSDINQAPEWCRTVCKYGISLPIMTLAFMTIFGGNEELRTTGRVFLLGMPFVLWGKDLIKSFHFDANRRPWCDRFPCKERAMGGFPSGHMAEVAFMTVLYGKRFGYKAAMPLAIFSTFLGATFLNCNRHYLSQLIAGSALGAIFALAADKVIDNRLARKYNAKYSCGFDVDLHGSPALKVSYSF